MRYDISLLVVLLLAACQSSLPAHNDKIEVSILHEIKPGATKEQVQARLGTPDRTLDMRNLPDSKTDSEIWEYDRSGLRRLSISFDPSLNSIRSLTLEMGPSDKELNLRTMLAQFPKANWTVASPQWINPHAFPDECRYVDNKLGIAIEYRRTRQEVDLVSSWDPAREPASEKASQPKFCVEDKCVPAISGTDWAKNFPPCKIPK
jgi:hypothetical protein